MLKIFLVEDEIVVREGIKRKVPWEDYDFKFVGEASDGELAYPLIQKEQPDIVITDIKMPFMDGLELSKLVRKEMPWVKIIILSGYDDFQYAKQAISIGVTDYLLKPISRAKLVEALLRVKEILDEENEQKDFLRQYQMETEEHQRLEHTQFFEELVGRCRAIPELLEKAEKLGLELVASGYAILLFNFDPGGETGDGYSDQLVRIQQTVENHYTGQKDCILFKRGLDGYALLIKSDTPQGAADRGGEYAKFLADFAGQYEGVQYFIAAGLPVQRLSELPKAYETASKAFVYRYLTSQSRIVAYGETPLASPVQNADISLKTLDTAKIDRKIVERFLRSGTGENAGHFVADYFESLGAEHVKSLLFRQYIAMDLHLAAAGYLEGIGVSREDFVEHCGDIDQAANAFSSLEGTEAYLERMLAEALTLRDQVSNKRYSALLQRARDYIGENYANEEISLNVVARVVNISPTHFSTIFSQEMGQTFIEYLTSVRMDKAKELLRCSGMRSSEIAYRVGYKDPHYFSYLFKKLQGCTPMEYRGGKETEK